MVASPVRLTLAQKLPQLRGCALSTLVAIVHVVPGRDWYPVPCRTIAQLTGYSPRHLYQAFDILAEFDLVAFRSIGKGLAPEFKLFPTLDGDLEFPLEVRLEDPAAQVPPSDSPLVPPIPSDVMQHPLIPSEGDPEE